MACGSGSARSAVRALRNRYADTSPAQTVNTSSACSKEHAGSTAKTTSDKEHLLEAYSLVCSSDSDSSSHNGSGGTPRRTMTLVDMQEPEEFSTFVERRLARESKIREEASLGESSMRSVSDPKNNNKEELFCRSRNQGADCDESCNGDSDAPSLVRRSLRLDSFPDASEHLAPKTLKTVWQACTRGSHDSREEKDFAVCGDVYAQELTTKSEGEERSVRST
eukprot:TRINITY_DN50941_c0_g1_i1.p1 TRINITY_DN50941_c0_g1~~TRINITY_DN50941_c0_g1_i1.p1  ORF type:complete len:231 (-),score=20.47 TRINITY_DN50941_c0_g1_i1:597-1262(-)